MSTSYGMVKRHVGVANIKHLASSYTVLMALAQNEGSISLFEDYLHDRIGLKQAYPNI